MTVGSSSLRIIVTGLIAQHPMLGGVTWDYLQYAVGLARLGHAVYYLEDSGRLACGLPIVTTAVGGMLDYVDPSCAVLVGAGDARGMADAVLGLAAERTLRRDMGRRSRARALSFDWGRVAEQMLGLYDRPAAAPL
jgi:glycosyltransferase involved in cell wall biosynthesis